MSGVDFDRLSLAMEESPQVVHSALWATLCNMMRIS